VQSVPPEPLAYAESLPISSAAPNPYERWTTNVLVCPVVRQAGS